jgi:hypothetical protein
MKPKAVVYTAASLLFMAACDASAPTATKQMSVPTAINPEAIVYMTNEQDVQLGSVHTNPCNLDVITVTAGSHFIVMTGFDNNGGLHYAANVITKGQGVGAKVYKINEHFHYIENNPTPQDGFVIRQLGTIKVDGPSTGDDYYMMVTFKTTVNAQGVPTSEVESTSYKCTP